VYQWPRYQNIVGGLPTGIALTRLSILSSVNWYFKSLLNVEGFHNNPNGSAQEAEIDENDARRDCGRA
jgi:hypothetical protein